MTVREPLTRQLFFRWVPVLVWMGLIFYLSAQPSLPRAPEDLLDLLLKKGGHFVGYFVLAILVARALGTHLRPGWRIIALALGVTVAYAITDEFHQSFVTLRTPSPWDVGIDALGAAFGLLVWSGRT